MTEQARKINSRRILMMVDALRESPKTVAQLAEVADIAESAVRRWIGEMRDEKLMRISGYTHDVRGRLFTPLHALGGEPDAPRPERRSTAKERMARMRQRRREAGIKPVPRAKGGGIGIDDLLG